VGFTKKSRKEFFVQKVRKSRIIGLKTGQPLKRDEKKKNQPTPKKKTAENKTFTYE
jgi:hypothetical protein